MFYNLLKRKTLSQRFGHSNKVTYSFKGPSFEEPSREDLIQEIEGLYEEAARLEQISQLLLVAAEKEPNDVVRAFVKAIREGC